MKRILEYIETKKGELSQSAFLRFVSDSRVEPLARFGFVPCLAPFVMAFMDINKHILRDDSAREPLQKLLNTQSREEDSHWQMYLRDLKTLGANPSMDLTLALKLLWSEECKRTRRMSYELTALFLGHEDPRLRLVLVEAIEGTADASFGLFTRAAFELEAATGKRLHYFGRSHEFLEEKHTLGSDAARALLEAVELSPEEFARAVQAVDKVFALFALMFEELLEYALRANPQAWPVPERRPDEALAA